VRPLASLVLVVDRFSQVFFEGMMPSGIRRRIDR
jgi:hypothetical protein